MRDGSRCYACGAPVVETDTLNGLAEFRITPEMYESAAIKLESLMRNPPTGTAGWLSYAQAVLHAGVYETTKFVPSR